MRFIDKTRLRLPSAWLLKANEAKRQILQGEKKINDRNDIWKDLKDALSDLSNDKCWYCECTQIRSDDAVDHFRPKNKVADTFPVHNGYWWLAFENDNYRYSCTFCNSKRKNPETGETEGKGDSFPLIDETKRCYSPISPNNEDPLLIDPCKSNDVVLLDFRDDGNPCPRYPDDVNKKNRADVSIKLYHLDHPSIVEKRRKLALDIKKKIIEIDEFIMAHPGLEPSETLKNDLQNYMNERAELSTFARRIIMGYRDREWVEDLIRTA